MAWLDPHKLSDVRVMLACCLLLGVSVATAHFTGMFFMIPNALWPYLGIQTPVMASLYFAAMLMLSFLPYKAMQWAIVRVFRLDEPAEAIGALRKSILFVVTILAGLLGSAIFASMYLNANLAEIGLGWMIVATVVLPVILASDRLVSALNKLRNGDGIKPEDVFVLGRATKSAAVVLLIASFACGWLHMSQRLYGNYVNAPDVEGEKLIWVTPFGEFFADFYGGPYDLKKTVTWYFQPWQGQQRRTRNTTDLLMRESLRTLFRMERLPKEK